MNSRIPPNTPARHDTVGFSSIQLHPLLASDGKKKDSDKKQPSTDNPYLQHRGVAPKKRPGIKINKPGKFIKAAEQDRVEEELTDLMKQVEGRVDMSTLILPSKEDYWWDEPFLRQDGTLNYDLIDDQLHDPEPAPLPLSLSEGLTAAPKPLHLTKAEAKKLRRERRLADQRDRQEQVRLGLLAPDQPRHKLSSLVTMAVQQPSQAGDALSAPTSRELEIRKGVAERSAKHDADNSARALGAAGKRGKLIKKYREDLVEGQVFCLIVKLPSLLDGKTQFKLCANARQNHLFGVFAQCASFCFVLVEGGPAAIKRYKHLVVDRMSDMSANLVFEGAKRRPDFKQFQSVSGDFEARTVLESHGNADIWRILVEYIAPQ